MASESSNYSFISKELSGPAKLEALHKRPAHHYTHGIQPQLEEERKRNSLAQHYPWEKSWHTRQFIGPLSEYGLLGYLIPAFRYSYYQTPEGHDCHLKCLWWVKYGGLAGFSWAVFHGSGNISAASENRVQKMLRFSKSTGTPALAGVTYAAVSCMFTQLRGKDDVLNNGFAGAAAGGVIGACIRSPGWGSTWGLVFGLSGMLVKYLQQHKEIPMLPDRYVPRDVRVVWGYDKASCDPWFKKDVENRPSKNAIRVS